MSLQAASFTFPKQQAIIDYITNHPIKPSLDTKVIDSKAPDGVQKVANYFAEKKISIADLNSNVKTALLTDNKDHKELTDLTKALANLILSFEEIDKNSSTGQEDRFTADMKKIHQQASAPDELLELTFTLYETVLKDLIEGATFTPPKNGEIKWTRHVTVVNPNENKN